MQTIEHTALDIAAVNPKNGAKFSPNLYQWLTKRENSSLRKNAVVCKDKDGTLFIGAIDDGWLHGSKLMRVLLVAKGGGSRELVIDRKSGRLIEGASAQEWPPKGQ